MQQAIFPSNSPGRPGVGTEPLAGRAIALETRNLGVTYGTGTVGLAPQTLQFAQGDFVVLLGASGAGKSTLLRSLNGLVMPTQGQIIVPGGRSVISGDGERVRPSVLRAHRRNTGMIFQQHHLIGRLSVLSNVLLGRIGFLSNLRSLLPTSRAEKLMALEAIERVGLLDHAIKRADQLSGGQQQRVGVARALIQGPEILLADEPVASLDPATAQQLLTLIHDICKKDGLTAIVSLHQVDLACRFADRIIGLRGGDVVFDGAPAELSKDRVESLYSVASMPRPRANDSGVASSSNLHPIGELQ